MHDVGRPGGVGTEQLFGQICGEPQHRSAQRRAVIG